jgi:isopentenyl diphosphate isomerase/L-lactate dehydrogenase-like FMN-dependent dehydrogenase
MVGRPYLYGLAVAGGAGVEAVLTMLADETRKALTLMGVASVTDLNRAHVVAPN